MALITIFVVALTMAVRVTADTVWAAAAYITHGETSPLLAGSQHVLTPDGAQQMWRQGSAFRRRYLSASNGTSLRNMPVDTIDNRQLAVASRNKAWVFGGALAFLQGLYPPHTTGLGRNYAAGNAAVEYPLSGYQYPLVQTLSSQDPSSVGIQGDVGCLAWQQEIETSFLTRKDVIPRTVASDGVYKELFTTQPLQGIIPLEQANYANAMEVYNLVKYLYTHNETVNKNLEKADSVIRILGYLAFSSERYKTGYNGSAPMPLAEASSAGLYSIAGRTLATQLARRLASAVGVGGARGKMTLMFGSPRPLISLFSVLNLITRETLGSGPLSRMPGPGAALVFEVVSDAAAGAGRSFPRTTDLRVRLSYKPSADANEDFTTYPLFGSGLDGAAIPYTAFLRQMTGRGATVTQWCRVCHADLTSPWCSSGSAVARSGLNSALVGVISAALLLFVVAFIAVVFCLRKGSARWDGKKLSFGALGGFRRWQKGPCDADVSVSRIGAAEARIGSWELRQGAGGASSGAHTAGIVNRNFSTPSTFREYDDDGVSLTGLPVKPRETL
ncbi:hypothetical protein L249_3224 [Ophiocordyceps polyrhachis-furcata BCC 54312]|uniref:Histidine acid phosphatase n=1 Tax=Ophiocordyceps polyrhachis-furcata BCC 54312 TaxID=1330021 RepID=A0A367LPL0_9HYPO|nr:hypothetical protein L249_3224 [Ophiocordyceps polyrhachis-furcata BCC 54312]